MCPAKVCPSPDPGPRTCECELIQKQGQTGRPEAQSLPSTREALDLVPSTAERRQEKWGLCRHGQRRRGCSAAGRALIWSRGPHEGGLVGRGGTCDPSRGTWRPRCWSSRKDLTVGNEALLTPAHLQPGLLSFRAERVTCCHLKPPIHGAFCGSLRRVTRQPHLASQALLWACFPTCIQGCPGQGRTK